MADIVHLATELVAGRLSVEDLCADPVVTHAERRDVFALTRYIILRRIARPAQRRACRLLTSLLTPTQRVEWRRTRKSFRVQGSAGGWYRLYPATGSVWRVERHGAYEIGTARYCLHDPAREMPPADETVGHLLLLTADEPGFLSLANATIRPHMGWDGDWHRRCRAARLALLAAHQASRSPVPVAA